MMHGKTLIRESVNGNQLLLGQQIRLLDKKTLTNNTEEITASWVQHFTMLFNQPGDVRPEIEANLPQQQQQQGSIRTGPFSELELNQAIKCMQNDKAAGPDGFAVEIDKYASGPEARTALLLLYNSILATGEVPAVLRDVIITVLYKGKGGRDDCNNYRGISLMAHRGKILERLILNRLQPALKSVIPCNQFGFTEGCGTTDAILISRVVGIDAEKEHTGLVRCYIDLTKAYDKVNRQSLWKLLRLYGIPEELVRIIISFHEGAIARLRLDGELSLLDIQLQRGLKQGSVLSPVLFNIFMGTIVTRFEELCMARLGTGGGEVGVRINYNFSGDLISDSKKDKKKNTQLMKTFTLLDVLYADDCVLFANWVPAMQKMVDIFDQIATIFGMVIAIDKTKVICNAISKAMNARNLSTEEVRYQTRRHTQLIEDGEGQHVTPKISIRGKLIDVVPSFKYLGLHDTEDGALENTVRARIIRMELRFKQFQGRVLMNRHVGIEARLNVFKTVVMTNGVYACETWNYTTNDIARIERHYFRLLRDVLLMSRSADPATTFFSVMDYAAQQGIEEIFPMECLIQRQQLKFLWKIVHLEDTAIQKIVLFGKISSQYNGRKGGRRQTYVNCLKLALANFGVSMKECMEMTELDWEFLINNHALLEATAKWKAKPSALKTIDNFWAPGIQTRGKRKRIVAEDDEDDGTEDPLRQAGL